MHPGACEHLERRETWIPDRLASLAVRDDNLMVPGSYYFTSIVPFIAGCSPQM